MHALIVIATNADAGAVHFGQAVDVVNLNAQFILDALAHLLAPTLGTDDALLQGDLVVDAAGLDFLGQKQGIRRGCSQDGGLHVAHELQLLFGVARTHGDGHRTNAFGARLEADARGPQTVAWGDLDTVLVGDARHFVAAREQGCPVVNVLLGVGDDDGRTRGARAGMDADDLFFGDGGKSQGVSLAKIGLLGEGDVLEVFLSLDGCGIEVGVLLGIESRTLFKVGKLFLQQVELHFVELHDNPVPSLFDCCWFRVGVCLTLVGRVLHPCFGTRRLHAVMRGRCSLAASRADQREWRQPAVRRRPHR